VKVNAAAGGMAHNLAWRLLGHADGPRSSKRWRISPKAICGGRIGLSNKEGRSLRAISDFALALALVLSGKRRARRFYERHGFQVVAFTDGERNEEKMPDVP
jgi:hypothetical protein